MRTILFTGKGGVGKTTAAAGTAALSASRGLRTLVMSTDTALKGLKKRVEFLATS